MAELTNIYDFESQIEDAIVTALTDAGLAALSPESTIELRKDRPRVEVTVQVGAANDGHYARGSDLVYRHDLYTCNANLYILTGVREDYQGTENHAAYRAAVRVVMAAICASDTMANLKLRHCVPQGSSGKATTQEGFEESTLQYQITFEVKAGAWP